MSHVHLALALGGDRPTSAAELSLHAREAEVGLLDLITVDVSGEGAGELDAVLAATRLATTTRAVGLVPTVHAGRSDPSSIARSLDALVRAGGGRAGVQLQVPVPADEQGWAAAVRRRSTTGEQPLLALPGRPGRGRRALPGAADVAFVAPGDTDGARRLASAARSAEQSPRHLLADVVVVLDASAARAAERAARTAPDDLPTTAPGGAPVLAGTPAQLADLALDWCDAGLSGLRLHPADPALDVRAVTRGLVPELQRRGAFRRAYGGADLRERLDERATRAAEHCAAA